MPNDVKCCTQSLRSNVSKTWLTLRLSYVRRQYHIFDVVMYLTTLEASASNAQRAQLNLIDRMRWWLSNSFCISVKRWKSSTKLVTNFYCVKKSDYLCKMELSYDAKTKITTCKVVAEVCFIFSLKIYVFRWYMILLNVAFISIKFPWTQ